MDTHLAAMPAQMTPAAEAAIRAFEAARWSLQAALGERRSRAMVFGRYRAMQQAAAAVRLATGLDVDLQHLAWEARGC